MTATFDIDLVGGGFTDMATGISSALKLLAILQETNEVPDVADANKTHALAHTLHVLLSRMGMVNEITGNAVIPGLFEPLDVNRWMNLDIPGAAVGSTKSEG